MVDGLGWFQVQWPDTWGAVDIATKELIPVVIAAALWGSRWAGKHVCFHTDNMSVVAILSSQAARTPGLTNLMRCFLFYAAYYRFHFTAKHIPGVQNTAADALLRNRLPLFFSLVPQVQQFNIMSSILQLMITRRPDWGSPDWTKWFTDSLKEGSQGQS